MEENKINLLNEPLKLEDCSEQSEKEKIKRIGAYIAITVSFFIIVVACIFSEIGYTLIKKGDASFIGTSTESVLKSSYMESIFKRFLGVKKTFNIKDKEDTPNIADEQSEKNEDDLFLPVEADTESEKETIPEVTDEATVVKYPVISLDLSQAQLGENYIVNETGYTPDIEGLKNSDESNASLYVENKDLPTVLILHTHGTESYLEDGKEYYTDEDGDISRTQDTSKNMVRIGSIISDTLNNAGIKTIHCEVLHDAESYQDSYLRASESIKSYLAKYPSIKYVFDIHRDAILKSDGSLVKASTEFNGETVAQVMTVVGSDYKGANFPNWENNLCAALKLKQILDDDAPSISRPVYLRGAAYNQQYAPCSLLLEIGTSGNTLNEAEKAAEIVAEAIIELIADLSSKH